MDRFSAEAAAAAAKTAVPIGGVSEMNRTVILSSGRESKVEAEKAK